MPQDMRPRRPERSNRFPDLLVCDARVAVDVARVCDFAARRALRQVDFLVRQGGEFGHAEALGQGVDAGVAQEGDAVFVGGVDGEVVFEVLAADCGVVVCFVEEFEEGGCGGEVFGLEFDAARLSLVLELGLSGSEWWYWTHGCVVGELSTCFCEEGALHEQALVRVQSC